MDNFIVDFKPQKESSMSKQFAPEFREEAVRQVTERGYSVADVANRLGVS